MRYVIPAVVAALLVATAALAAEMFDIKAYGNFKHMAHTGETKGVVKLSALDTSKGSYGVGALAGLRGEIFLWDGRLLVSRGHSPKGSTEAPAASDEAVIFVGGKVNAWRELTIPTDMNQAQFEAFVVENAKKNGIAPDRPFPFAVRGTGLNVVWHVVTGAAPASGHSADGGHAAPAGGHAPAPAAHGRTTTHQQGHAGMHVFKEHAASGTLLGFYTATALEGIASHPGERFHVHYASTDFSVSGHVDEYRISRGANLLLPAK